MPVWDNHDKSSINISIVKKEVLITAYKYYSFHYIKQYTVILLILQTKRATALVTGVLLIL